MQRYAAAQTQAGHDQAAIGSEAADKEARPATRLQEGAPSANEEFLAAWYDGRFQTNSYCLCREHRARESRQPDAAQQAGRHFAGQGPLSRFPRSHTPQSQRLRPQLVLVADFCVGIRAKRRLQRRLADSFAQEQQRKLPVEQK